MCMSRYSASGKFGEHERGVRVARGVINHMVFASSCTVELWMHSRDVLGGL